MKYKPFSADDHVDLKFLPPDLWQKRAASAYRRRAPRIEERPEGRRWMVDGTPFGGILGILPRESDASRGKPLGSGRDHAIGKNATPNRAEGWPLARHDAGPAKGRHGPR